MTHIMTVTLSRSGSGITASTLALKKNVIRLNARLKGYKDHEAMLTGKYALAERVWKEDPYHHGDY